MKRIGVLTGGGDCPGLNGAIRAVVRSAIGGRGWEVVGFRNGWRGVMDGDVLELSTESVRGILHRGGTILGSSGADPYHEGGIDRVRSTFEELRIEGLIAIGGEGTLGAAASMTEEDLAVIGTNLLEPSRRTAVLETSLRTSAAALGAGRMPAA